MEPKFQVQLKICKPVSEVFRAVVAPEQLTGYFIQSSSGPLADGASVKWHFAEVPESVDVVVSDLIEDERVVFDWGSGDRNNITRVTMTFKAIDNHNTMVQISESGWPQDDKGIRKSYDNAGGWMHMMCCMKAYLEYGINLRAGGAA